MFLSKEPMKIFVSSNYVRLFSLLFLMGGFVACTDPVTVGSELLNDDRVDVGFTADMRIAASTVLNDSVQVYSSSGAQLSRYLIGRIEDDVFGATQRDIYVTPELARNGQNLIATPLFVDRDSFEIDSMVLILPYDTTDLYGDIFGATIEYEMYELTEQVNNDLNYYSNLSLSISSSPIATGSATVFSGARLVSDTIISSDSTTIPHIRIPMPMEIIERLAQADTGAYASDAAFVDSIFAGVLIRPTSSNNAFLNVNTRGVEANFNTYFHKIDGSLKTFYPFNIDRTLGRYTFDRTGSLAESLLNGTGDNRQALLEGGGGLMTRVEILNADELSGKVINQAKLEFYVDQSTDFDYETYPLADNILLFYRDGDGYLQVINDVSVLPAGTNAANRIFFLGGDLKTDDEDRAYYQANLSVHLQSIIDGDNDPVIYIRVIPSDITPNRMIIRGETDTAFPMNLKVSFTEF